MTIDELLAVYDGKCPDCGGTVTDGPHGGASVNMLCYGCGSRFNVLSQETIADLQIGLNQLAGTALCERLNKMSPETMEQLKKLYP